MKPINNMSVSKLMKKDLKQTRGELTSFERYLQKLEKAGYTIKRFTEYHYRINGVLDIFPVNKRYHDLRDDTRGTINF